MPLSHTMPDRSVLIRFAGVFAILLACVPADRALGQVRGVYPLGMSATNSGVTPDPGFTYSNSFLFYARDELVGPDGEVLATGSQSVMMDMNTFVWVGKKRIRGFGGARYSFSVTLPLANNSLSSDVQGAINGGGGLADTYYQPFILGWHLKRAQVRAVYGFLAPTGKFSAGATDNVGSGYWTHVVSAGETISLTEDGATALSAFQMYEFHGVQEGTDIRPGQTFSLDFSLTRVLPLRNDSALQVGLVGYGQWQTTDKSGPNLTPAQESEHYTVHALGVAFNVLLPTRKASVGAKYFKEFSNSSTFEGYSLQISAAITF